MPPTRKRKIPTEAPKNDDIDLTEFEPVAKKQTKRLPKKTICQRVIFPKPFNPLSTSSDEKIIFDPPAKEKPTVVRRGGGHIKIITEESDNDEVLDNAMESKIASKGKMAIPVMAVKRYKHMNPLPLSKLRMPQPQLDSSSEEKFTFEQKYEKPKMEKDVFMQLSLNEIWEMLQRNRHNVTIKQSRKMRDSVVNAAIDGDIQKVKTITKPRVVRTESDLNDIRNIVLSSAKKGNEEISLSTAWSKYTQEVPQDMQMSRNSFRSWIKKNFETRKDGKDLMISVDT